MRASRATWLNNCHCNETDFIYFHKYRADKKLIRESLRIAMDEYESFLARKIETEMDVDQEAVWTILNRRKKKSATCSALKKDGIL